MARISQRHVGKALRLTGRTLRLCGMALNVRLTGMSPRLARMALRLTEGSETDCENDEFGLIGSDIQNFTRRFQNTNKR